MQPPTNLRGQKEAELDVAVLQGCEILLADAIRVGEKAFAAQIHVCNGKHDHADLGVLDLSQRLGAAATGPANEHVTHVDVWSGDIKSFFFVLLKHVRLVRHAHEEGTLAIVDRKTHGAAEAAAGARIRPVIGNVEAHARGDFSGNIDIESGRVGVRAGEGHVVGIGTGDDGATFPGSFQPALGGGRQSSAGNKNDQGPNDAAGDQPYPHECFLKKSAAMDNRNPWQHRTIRRSV